MVYSETIIQNRKKLPLTPEVGAAGSRLRVIRYAHLRPPPILRSPARIDSGTTIISRSRQWIDRFD